MTHHVAEHQGDAQAARVSRGVLWRGHPLWHVQLPALAHRQHRPAHFSRTWRNRHLQRHVFSGRTDWKRLNGHSCRLEHHGVTGRDQGQLRDAEHTFFYTRELLDVRGAGGIRLEIDRRADEDGAVRLDFRHRILRAWPVRDQHQLCGRTAEIQASGGDRSAGGDHSDDFAGQAAVSVAKLVMLMR